MIIAGVDDKRNKFGETPLHVATKRGEVAKAKELLGRGANANIPVAAGKERVGPDSYLTIM